MAVGVRVGGEVGVVVGEFSTVGVSQLPLLHFAVGVMHSPGAHVAVGEGVNACIVAATMVATSAFCPPSGMKTSRWGGLIRLWTRLMASSTRQARCWWTGGMLYAATLRPANKTTPIRMNIIQRYGGCIFRL